MPKYLMLTLMLWRPLALPVGAFSTANNNLRQDPSSKVLAISRRTSSNTRRQLLSFFFGVAPSSLFIDNVYASCITGDESTECIGVYKEGIPESSHGDGSHHTIEQSYGVFRPDRATITLPNPTSLKEALGMLTDQTIALDHIEKLISSASFESAGIHMLRVLPRLVIAGRYIAATTAKTVPQIKQMAEDVSTLALAVDKNIGKALRGTLGGSATMSQLTLLSDVKALRVSLDRFISRATV